VLTKKGLQRAIYLLFFVFSIIFMAPFSHGFEKTFPLDKVKPGMSGYGYTVFSGTKIEKFNIKILSMVDNDLGKGQLILVKLTGKQLEESGGLSAGMSGSPVYLNGQLLGAISYGFENADSSLALVTPIDSMLKLLNSGEKSSFLTSNGLKAVPVASPVIISGMKRRGFELLSSLLEPYGFKAVFAPNSGVSSLEMGKGLIKPGSAIAVLMVAGDYQVSAIGTATWVEGKDFLAFGHPYSNKGRVDYFAYQANIMQTVKSSQMSFKIGAPLKLIGRITEDRQSGILGRLEETPVYIPVHISVKDSDRQLTKNVSFFVVAGEQVFHDLIISGVTDTIDQTIDRVGLGTAKVTVNIERVDNKAKIYRENLFCSKDIAIACTKDLNDLLTIINDNDFSTIGIKNISINAEINSDQETARIVKIVAETTKIKAGDTVKLNVELHKYRGDNVSIPVEIKVPVSMKPGKLIFTADGGSKDPANGQEEDTKKESFKLEYKDIGSFHDLLTNYLNKPRNNDLVVEYDSASDSKNDDSLKNAMNSENENSKPLQVKLGTQYYLLGEAQITIEVQQP
jgi:SpoIVB peptidase S55